LVVCQSLHALLDPELHLQPLFRAQRLPVIARQRHKRNGVHRGKRLKVDTTDQLNRMPMPLQLQQNRQVWLKITAGTHAKKPDRGHGDACIPR
jgi:hypothetical protein